MAKNKRRGLALAFVLCLCLCPQAARAAYPGPVLKDMKTASWNLSADNVHSLAGGAIIEASGKVELRLGADFLQADFARYFRQSGWVYLSGSVRAGLGRDRLSAEEAEFDLQSRTGWLKNGLVFLADSHSYFRGEHITRRRGDIYSFKELSYSACGPESPVWSFEAGEGVLELEGYARLRDVKFLAAGVPLLYSPYMVLPVKRERQTGFLAPDQGQSGALGFFYTQPFFLALDNSSDLTFYEGFMSRRGLMHGLAYRSRASEDESLWLSLDFLKDRLRVGSEAEDEYYRGDRLIRPDTDRFWLRGMYEARLPGSPLWRFRADADYVSDQYFLREFSRGATGFNRNREDLFSRFARDLRDVSAQRLSAALLFREWSRAGLYLSGAYSQNPALGNADPALGRPVSGAPRRSDDPTVQRLPELSFYLYQGGILAGLPLEAAAGARAAYLYRRSGGSGGRFDLSPGLILPLAGEYGSLISSARLRSTWYSLSGDRAYGRLGPEASARVKRARHLPDLELRSGTEFFRVYAPSSWTATPPEAGESSWVALRHSIQPRLAYRYTPDIKQGRNPYFDAHDRLLPVNELVFSLDNILARKRESLAPPSGGTEAPARRYDYLDLLRLRLEQAYDFNEARRGRELERWPRAPWRDLMAELTLNPGSTFSWSSAGYFNHQEVKFSKYTHSFRLKSAAWGHAQSSLNMYKPVDDYFQRSNYNMTTLSISGETAGYGPWSASAYWEWPLKRGNARPKEEKGLTLTYTHQCFTLNGQVIRDETDTSFKLGFSLSGLGL